MAFINTLHNVIRKSNRDLLYFYTADNCLFLKEFNLHKSQSSSVKILDNIDEHLINIQINEADNVYGIAAMQTGDVLYLYSDKNNPINKKKLFSFDSEKYELLFPFIMKSNKDLHIIYYFRELQKPSLWTLLSHYYDGSKWYEHCIDAHYSYPFPSPFKVVSISNFSTIIYLKDDKIYSSSFVKSEKKWAHPISIINTHGKKIHFSVLNDKENLLHLSWSEFTDGNLVIKYTNCILNNNSFAASNINNLSHPSNCSFPSISKIDNVLWTMWVQLDQLHSSYSTDNGFKWSPPSIDSKAQGQDYIRYNFSSNYAQDLTHFNVSTIFGTFKPRISFIGFNRSVEG